MKKCVYTNRNAMKKDIIVPADKLGDEVHNWAKGVPACERYVNMKGNKMPTETEMQIHETFYKLEIYKLKIIYYENKLKELQDLLKRENILRNSKDEALKERAMDDLIDKTQDTIDQMLKFQSQNWKDETDENA